jgi:hypothetical protein
MGAMANHQVGAVDLNRTRWAERAVHWRVREPDRVGRDRLAAERVDIVVGFPVGQTMPPACPRVRESDDEGDEQGKVDLAARSRGGLSPPDPR